MYQSFIKYYTPCIFIYIFVLISLKTCQRLQKVQIAYSSTIMAEKYYIHTGEYNSEIYFELLFQLSKKSWHGTTVFFNCMEYEHEMDLSLECAVVYFSNILK